MSDEAKPQGRNVLAIRLAIGLAQGLALYALYRWRQNLIPTAYGGLVMTAWLVPIAALGAYGTARTRTLAAWLAGATVITLVIGGYALFVETRPPWRQNIWLPGATAFFTAAAIFILHHLILPADVEGRWRASFTRYFDEGWKDAVRLALAALFVGLFWLLLWLGAALFKLIGLDFLQKLIEKPWFDYPATAVFFAMAVHVTDIRAGLVQGARTLVLTLFSWLLPVLTLIAVGFLVALPFTGLKPLLATRTSTGVMLSACAALIILINAAYQDGEREDFPPTVLKWTARIAGAALAPLTLVAIYGIGLRIGQYGLTPRRIHAAACVIVSSCYAAGYLWAAFQNRPWMKRLETTNWITAQISVVLLLGLFSPLFDPARISVASQIARLHAGQVTPVKFDYAFLRFQTGRWGAEGLKRLAMDRNPEIAELARLEQKRALPWEPEVVRPSDRSAALQAIGAPLPPSFVSQAWKPEDDPASNCDAGVMEPKGSPHSCPAVVTEFDGRPGPEVIVFYKRGEPRVFSEEGGRWREIGELQGTFCQVHQDAVRAGRMRLVPPTGRKDVEVDGRRFVFTPNEDCPQPKSADGKAAPDEDATDVSIIKPAPRP